MSRHYTPLDTNNAESIGENLIETLNDLGYTTPEEAIPGLVQAIVSLAGGDDSLLDSAANLLADGGV